MRFTFSLLLVFIISLNLIKSKEIIEEFKEKEITEIKQMFNFENLYEEELNYNPEIIIQCMNEYFDTNLESYIEISKTKKKIFSLTEVKTIIIPRDDELNEGKGEYKIIFKNYIGGKFYIYNSIHSFPLKDFSKFYILFYDEEKLSKLSNNLELKFHSEVLIENFDLIISNLNYNLKLFQINDIDIKEIKIEKNIIKLLKGYMYKLEYNVSYTDKNIEIYIGKREIQKYDSTLDKKSFYIRGFSSYFFINFNEMEKPMNESFLFSDYDYYRHKEFEIAYLNTGNIKDIDLDNIEYNEKLMLIL